MSVEILNSMGYEVVGLPINCSRLKGKDWKQSRLLRYIVITDYNMPQMNGIILANNIRSLDV